MLFSNRKKVADTGTDVGNTGLKVTINRDNISESEHPAYDSLGTNVRNARNIVAGIYVMLGVVTPDTERAEKRHKLYDIAKNLLVGTNEDVSTDILSDYCYELVSDGDYSNYGVKSATVVPNHHIFSVDYNTGESDVLITLFGVKSRPFLNSHDDTILYSILESVPVTFGSDYFTTEAYASIQSFVIRSGFVITAQELYNTVTNNYYLRKRIEGYYKLKQPDKDTNNDLETLVKQYTTALTNVTEDHRSNEGATLDDVLDKISEISNMLSSVESPSSDKDTIDIPIEEESEDSTSKVTDAVKNEVSRYYLSHSLKETMSKYPFASAPLISIWFKEVNGVTKTELIDKKL